MGQRKDTKPDSSASPATLSDRLRTVNDLRFDVEHLTHQIKLLCWACEKLSVNELGGGHSNLELGECVWFLTGIIEQKVKQIDEVLTSIGRAARVPDDIAA